MITRVKNKYGESVGAIIQLVGNGRIQATKQKDQGCRPLTTPQGGAEGDGLGGLGHSGPLVTISSPSGIVKPLVAAQPPQPPPAYGAAAAPSPQHQKSPNPQTQQDPSRSVQPIYTVVDGDAIASLPYPHFTAPRLVILAAALQPQTPWPPGRPRHPHPPAAQRVIRALKCTGVTFKVPSRWRAPRAHTRRK